MRVLQPPPDVNLLNERLRLSQYEDLNELEFSTDYPYLSRCTYCELFNSDSRATPSPNVNRSEGTRPHFLTFNENL